MAAGPQPQQLAGRPVGMQDAAVHLGDADALVGVIEDLGELLRPLFGLSQPGEVLDRADPAPGLAGQEFQRAGDREMASALGVLVPEADLGGALRLRVASRAARRCGPPATRHRGAGAGPGRLRGHRAQQIVQQALPVSCWQWAS
jgi:hypothetical protein